MEHINVYAKVEKYLAQGRRVIIVNSLLLHNFSIREDMLLDI